MVNEEIRSPLTRGVTRQARGERPEDGAAGRADSPGVSRREFTVAAAVERLADEFCLSEERIRAIVYRKR